MRLLILDGSRILATLVERLAPEGVEILEVRTFEEAVTSLHQTPPDAVIANVGPAELPWREFKEYCANHQPRIPILFESCVYTDEIDAGIGGLNHTAAFLRKPYTLNDLRRQLERLLGASPADDDLDPEVERTDRLASFPEG
jgi:DNA-binding response OmpR family regulator